MKNKDRSVAPITLEVCGDSDLIGLTKFEYACIHIAAGLAGGEYLISYEKDLAERAVSVASYLFEEMEEAQCKN